MIKSLIKLAFILLVGILVYNYFLGTPSEKQGAEKIFNEVKDVAVGIKDLVKSEKEKFDAGKYDKAVDKVGELLSTLRKNAREFDEKYLDRIGDLEKKQEELRDAVSHYDEEKATQPEGSDSSSLRKELDELLRETESLIEDMEKPGK